MLRAVELAIITEQAKNKDYDSFYESAVMGKAKSLAEKGLSVCEITLKFNQENVEKYYKRTIQLLKQDDFTIIEKQEPSSWTRQDMYIKFSW